MLPEGWHRSTLGEMARISSGGTPDRAQPSYWGGKVPWGPALPAGQQSLTWYLQPGVQWRTSLEIAAMSGCCDCGSPPPKTADSSRYRRVLWIAFAVNLGMFGVEIASGWNAGSASLLADAVDFLGDAANYGLSLAVLSLAMVWRSRAALIKGLSMGAYGLFVLGQAAWNLSSGVVPAAGVMGAVGLIALIANVLVALLLYSFRDGDANMRSVWLCSRNDAIGNLAVMLAAVGVFGLGQGWPDIVVAVGMAGLGLSAAVSVVRHARQELAIPAIAAAAPQARAKAVR